MVEAFDVAPQDTNIILTVDAPPGTTLTMETALPGLPSAELKRDSICNGNSPLLPVDQDCTSPDRIAVPPHAVEILRDCIGARTSAPVINERIREALALMCDEAHRSDAMPEHLLVTLKELCHSLPEYERISGAPEREVFLSSLVTTAIEEYYKV